MALKRIVGAAFKAILYAKQFIWISYFTINECSAIASFLATGGLL
jgi:hypothetical protein